MSVPVCLINPPFGAIEHPNIGLGLLKASAHKAGVSCRILHASLGFADRLGLPLYFWFASSPNYLDFLGEWLFAGELFSGNDDDGEYLQRFLVGNLERDLRFLLPGQNITERLYQMRHMAAEFIEQTASEVVASRPKVVGCTSSFQQNCAALALLKKVRQLDDSVVTLLGGANCETPMAYGLRRGFPWVDFVVSGEAEMIFPELLRQLLRHGRDVDEAMLPACVIGPSRAADPAPPQDRRGLVWDLDTVTSPEYSDYFEQLSQSPLAPEIAPGLLLETSRGCWWGKKRCKFCALNGSALKYRVKSADCIMEEIAALCSRYETWKIMFVDNNLEPRLAREIFPRLAELHKPLRIFFETRVIDKRQLELMAKGGISWLTVGIESFHSRLLDLMGKGTTMLENIQFLRWTYELGIRVIYSLLYGFPGDRDEWYGEMSDLLPLLHHLEPPFRVWPMRYDRFSEYHEKPQEFGLQLVPRNSYSYIYPLPPELINDIAYFFDDANGSQAKVTQGPGFKSLWENWQQWQEAFWTSEPGREHSFLYLLPSPGSRETMLYDTRACTAATTIILTGLETRILEYCDQVRTLERLEQHCAPEGYGRDAVSKAVETLIARQALLQENGSYLSLTVKPPRRAYLPVKDFPGGYYSPEMSRTLSIMEA